ncbi:hypothetical protein B0T21DRAFT_374592 [Apiosordaria backusii]|uniref:Uncharacterized protein n=1 Tax=Apiosordaria backusii TaxID=314023 RepID=A0AA40DXA2_9PEZI|nr:hypothetical protein B0T21DRAFT_374592 [Apiosordaria backusii]
MGWTFYLVWAGLNLINAIIFWLFYPETGGLALENWSDRWCDRRGQRCVVRETAVGQSKSCRRSCQSVKSEGSWRWRETASLVSDCKSDETWMSCQTRNNPDERAHPPNMKHPKRA